MSRERLSSERPSITRRFSVPYTDDNKVVHQFDFYAIVGLYDDGRVAEIFIYTDRKNDRFSGLLAGMIDTVSTAISIGLQYGVPLETFIAKLRGHRFGPSGFTGDKQFHNCTSVFDLVAQWLAYTFPEGRFIGWQTTKST